MGQLFIDAIFLRDYWVLNALVFIVTIFFILLNLLTDIIYAKLDPRIIYKETFVENHSVNKDLPLNIGLIPKCATSACISSSGGPLSNRFAASRIFGRR